MNTFNAIDLIPGIAAIRDDVLVNRDACRTGFARNLHDRLVVKLDDITVDLGKEAETEQRLAAERGTIDGDQWYEFYHICTSFERKWVECGPISLLDRIFEDVVFEGETCRVGLEYAHVPAAELEGLADILDTIRRRMGIAFIAARV
ncbi:MAG: hypothetical protein EOR16_16295 [Mesorhizobium sp.]|uniref:hypothetical protein n=1 Tax=Mesorhizobium sp. TaxID=1871066 RepID=UPI000FE475D9|nr:hypothetical protein [Mesorhizobium sp.]RWI57133.1 MAG: hypothetical protein EOR16_16295 [Mesorhizobium sp.]